MKFQIVTYGHSVLREKARPIETVDDEVRQLVRDMLTTMYESNGLGLAAQQVGRTEAICVIDVTGAPHPEGEPYGPMPLILINPVIVQEVGEEKDQEGCLSFPDVFVQIKRATEIIVEYMDLDGNKQLCSAKGLLARAIQHEVDHLNGILFVDHMSQVQKVGVSGKLKRLRKQASE